MATTRLYLGNAAPSFTPTTKRGTWNDATSTSVGKLSTTKTGASTSKAITETQAGAGYSPLIVRFVFDAGIVSTGTLSGTVAFCIGTQQNASGQVNKTKASFFVTAGATDTLRGSLLLNNTTASVSTSAVGQALSATAITSTAVTAGDLIVAEFGFSSSSTGTVTNTVTDWWGATGATDLVQGSTAVTTNPGWIEFSDPGGVILGAPTYDADAMFLLFT